MPAGVRDPGFCCAGCAQVFALLQRQGLTRFYVLGGGKGQPVGRVPRSTRRDWLPALEQQSLVVEPGVRLVLDIQGIRCAACVWLLETLWRRLAGAQRIDLNPARGQMVLFYDRTRLDVDAFLDRVEELGYHVAPASKTPVPLERGLLMRVGVCVALALNAMMFSLSSYLGMNPSEQGAELFRGLSLGLSTAALGVGGPVFWRAALAGLRQRVLHLDLPIALGLGLAYTSSLVSFASGAEGYFDTITIFIALMLVGRYVQMRALARNRDYLLRNDGAEHLRVRRRSGDRLEIVGVHEIRAGDRLWLVPGDLVPVHARLANSAGSFSLDWINGEATPRVFQPGDAVPAGSFHAGRVAVEAIAVADAAGSGLLSLLATPQRERDAAGRDRFWVRLNQRWVMLVLLAAAAAAGLWLWLDPSRTLSVVTAVLVVTCPCAIGIATPLAFDLVVGNLRRHGVWVRSQNLFERARHIRKVIFDKTGTVTWGGLHAEELRPVPPELCDTFLTMVSSSNHPVSRAIAAAIGTSGRLLPQLPVEEVVGQGLLAVADGHEFKLGPPSFVLGGGRREDRDGLCLLARDGHVEACFRLSEDLRLGFAAAIAGLQAKGYQTWLLSGDQATRTEAVANALGIQEGRALGELSPQAKADLVRQIDDHDTMMIGDGLNDAPAFEAATCAGTPAIDRPVMPAKADFFFAGGGAEAVGRVLEQSHRLHRITRSNLRLSLVYNVAAVAVCMAGWMTPLLCAVVMPLSSLATLLHTVWGLRAGGPDAHTVKGAGDDPLRTVAA